MTVLKIVFFAAALTLCTLTASAQKYMFYLHGRIVEIQGPEAVDNSSGYGAYRYFDILDTLRKNGFKVISEVRKSKTAVREYAAIVTRQIDSLMRMKVAPQDITVIGASKGAVIAMYVSTYVKNKEVNYVFIAGCGDDNFRQGADISLTGNVLSIYEKSDPIGQSCISYKNKSNAILRYKEIELKTGLRHGFLYKPLPEWTAPAVKWANQEYE